MSLFSTPQQQQQQQPSLFQFSSQPQQQQSLFSQQPQQFQQQQQQQQQQQPQQLFLFTKDKAPAGYGTKWADLHPDSQKVLLLIEEKILEYRDESQRLDQCSRLFDSSVSNDTFESDAGHVVQELGGIGTSMERQKAVLQELMTMVKDMLRKTEVAVRSFMILRPRFLHLKGGSTSNASGASQALGATTTPASQPTSYSSGPVVDFYSGLPTKPSLFMQETVARFEKYLAECRQWVEELEQLIFLDSEQNTSNSNSLLQSLPKVISNVHDFFIHVAAKAESIHQYIESMRAAYIADQRKRGEPNDPFLEADRRETARQEAASKRVHPTLHLPALPQPSTQPAGLFSSSAAPSGPSTAPQTSSAPFSSGGGFSLFGNTTSTPSAPSSSSALFATPAPASTPASSLFAASGASPQTPFFNLASSTSSPLFTGSSASFGSSAAAGGSGLFSTPNASGAAVGSGASFGTVSRSTRPKARSGRR